MAEWIIAITSIISVIVSLLTLGVLFNASKKFALQIALPEQINHMLTLYKKVQNISFDVLIWSSNTIIDRYKYSTKSNEIFSTTEIINGIRSQLDKKYFRNNIYFQYTFNPFESLRNEFDDYKTPKVIFNKYIELTISDFDDIKVENDELILISHNGFNSDGSLKFSKNNYQTLDELCLAIKDMIENIEKWLYKKGIDNFDYIYYKKKKL